MSRSRLATSIDYSQQVAINLDELDKRERLNINDVVSHGYLQRVLRQYELFGLQPDTLLFVTLTALGAISNRSFIQNSNNIPVMLNHGTNKSSYIKLIRHGLNSLGHHYEATYYRNIDKNTNKIDLDQITTRQGQESSSTSSKMLKVPFMTEVCTELGITKNLATTDTFLCHDEGDLILSTFGFYSPSDQKNAGGVNLLCSALDGLADYKRTTGHQCIEVKNSHLSMLGPVTVGKVIVLGPITAGTIIVPGSITVGTVTVVEPVIVGTVIVFGPVTVAMVIVVGPITVGTVTVPGPIIVGMVAVVGPVTVGTVTVVGPATEVLATTGSKMFLTLQVMHQRKEDEGVLGRFNIWYLSSSQTFVPPKHSKLISDIASIDHLLIIAHELFQYSPEFRFQKHPSDILTNKVISEEDEYMKSLRIKQGIINENPSTSSIDNDEYHHDVFHPCPDDSTENGGIISAYKLMMSILDCEFKGAQQMQAHLVGCARKATNKFPQICAILCSFEIIGEIASNLLKYIIFDEGNYSRPHSLSNKFISLEFVCAARQYVKNYITNLPVIDGRSIIYINKLQVERAFNFYTYVEGTTTMLFDASLINQTGQIVQETNLTNCLSKKEKQEMSWIIKVLQTPVIFFSNNYLCKWTPGCPGSGVFKNTTTEFRVHVLSLMTTYGLLMVDDYLSAMKTHSFVKVPPSILRQNESLVKLFTMFGPSLTLNTYEKLYENFGLVTTSDASIVPITPIGIKLLRKNNAFVNYYHCLDKDERVLHMIQERLNLKEICLICYGKNGPYRYELIDVNRKIINISSKNTNDNYNERVNSDTLLTSIITTTNHMQQHFSSADEVNQEEQQSNRSLLLNHMVGVNQKEIASLVVQDENHDSNLISEVHDHSQTTRQIQRKKSSESSISINSGTSSSSISLSSIDHQIPLQKLPLSSSPLPSLLFKEVLNINNTLSMNNMEILDLSTILEEQKSSLSNSATENSPILLQFVSPVTETPQFITQPFVPTDLFTGATISPITCPDIDQQSGLLECSTDNETNKSSSLYSTVVPTISVNSHDPVGSILPLFSMELQSNTDVSEHRSSNTSPMRLSFHSSETSTESLRDSSSISIVKKKRGRKSNIEKQQTSSPIHDIENILANCKHPIYKRLILLDGIVFSKTDLTHAVQQFADLRDDAIEKLCQDGIFIRREVFAKRSSSGDVEYLEGYIKCSPVDSNDTSSNIEEYIHFADLLATYDITTEEYIDSFNGKQAFLQNDEVGFIKHVLNRSHIKLKSYLFSLKFVDFVQNNNYFSQRFTIDNSDTCFDKPSMTPTTSNTQNVFAKKNSNGIIEYLDGYIKLCPTYNINNSASSFTGDNIKFAEMLGEYNITLEEYISSFDNKQSSPPNSNNNITKGVLSRTDIHLKTYLFVVSNEAVCWSTEGILPTTSSLAIDEYQQNQYKKINQRQISRKRTNENLLATAGPAPKRTRRRPRHFDQE
ncbi:unnamed protein product [Rotaria sp. Silwood1]|nr:unnamed protein product [Rotaria sp. Silwood1]